MLYFVVLPAILALFIYLTVTAERHPDRIKKYRLINLSLGSIGIIVLLATMFIGSALIDGSGQSDSWISWAFDMFSIYFKISISVFVFMLVILLLTTLLSIFDKKTRGGYPEKIRLITSIAASVILLLITFLYSPATENDYLPLDVLIVISGIAEAFAMRLTYALEYTVRLRKNDKAV